MRGILVTGATGTVGSALTALLMSDHLVRCATQSASLPANHWVNFSFERPETFPSALEGIGSVFLMRPPQMAKSAAFVPFLQAAKDRGISRVVVLSVMGADTNRLLPHHGLEEAVKRMQFDWTMVRPSDSMQNLETVIAAVFWSVMK